MEAMTPNDKTQIDCFKELGCDDALDRALQMAVKSDPIPKYAPKGEKRIISLLRPNDFRAGAKSVSRGVL